MHPAIEEKLSLFDYEHLPPHLQDVSEVFKTVAEGIVHKVGEGPQVTIGLQKLLEAKDCFVRQAVLNAKEK